MKMEALDGWGGKAGKIPASSIDWNAVAAGRNIPRVRELPWAGNSMGKAKFLFPNKLGIYLHDTPKRDLLRKDDRHFSNGCIGSRTLQRWAAGCCRNPCVLHRASPNRRWHYPCRCRSI
jgi:murein L,D-transpeptidase YcbB/YkuD